jgi:hypothetical protein
MNFMRAFPFMIQASASNNGGHIRLCAMCMEGATMKRALFWGTLLAGAVAAYMMYRRGESLGVIAAQTVINPVGSLVTELKTASS